MTRSLRKFRVKRRGVEERERESGGMEERISTMTIVRVDGKP